MTLLQNSCLGSQNKPTLTQNKFISLTYYCYNLYISFLKCPLWKKSNETWGELFFVQQSSSSQTPTGNINFIRYNEYLWRLEPLSWLLNRYFRLTRTESLPGKFRFGFGLMSHGQDKGIMMIRRKSNLNVKWLSNSDRIKPGSLNTVRCLWCTIWCNINKQHVNPVSTYQYDILGLLEFTISFDWINFSVLMIIW